MPISARRRLPPAIESPPDRYVAEIRVEGLFGTADGTITFGRNKNFLIGPNGSGKTTIVHILASCLRNDFPQLFELPFRRALVTLRSIGNSTDTNIDVAQSFNVESGRRLIHVEISGDFTHQEDIEARSQIERIAPAWLDDEDADAQVASTTAGLSSIIAQLTNTTWLSINRGEIRRPTQFGRQNLIDRHIQNISQRLAQFNSRRNSLITAENVEFQRQMFLSFLTPRISLATLRRLGALNVTQRIEQLREILRELGVESRQAETNLTRYRDDLTRAVAASQQRRQGRMDFREEATLLTVNQANDVISSWSDYRSKVATINEGVNELLAVFREYLEKKQVMLSDRGQLFFSFPPIVARTTRGDLRRPGRTLRPDQLSSGEKQIYIFLLEALLQREVISIFIADEPELSLHVAWQERLVSSILRLSPNAQLIFATHSPDIVGADQDAIIDMEAVLARG